MPKSPGTLLFAVITATCEPAGQTLAVPSAACATALADVPPLAASTVETTFFGVKVKPEKQYFARPVVYEVRCRHARRARCVERPVGVDMGICHGASRRACRSGGSGRSACATPTVQSSDRAFRELLRRDRVVLDVRAGNEPARVGAAS